VLPHVAVKKVRLRATKVDNKIFREVNALSRLSHRFIVRYYTTWVELVEPSSTSVSSGSESGAEEASGNSASSSPTSNSTADGRTSVPNSVRKHKKKRRALIDSPFDPFSIDLDDLNSASASQSSFPSIHFTGSGSAKMEDSDGDADVDSDDPFGNLYNGESRKDTAMQIVPRTPSPPVMRTLYIQMVRFLS